LLVDQHQTMVMLTVLVEVVLVLLERI